MQLSSCQRNLNKYSRHVFIYYQDAHLSQLLIFRINVQMDLNYSGWS